MLAALGVAVGLFAAYPDANGDSDLWWHLAYGKQVVESGTWVQQHDAWSWAPVQSDWRYVSWLADAILYGAYSLAGVPGLFAVQALIFGLVIAGYLTLVWRRRGRIEIFDLLVILAVFLAIRPSAIHRKAELFTVLFFAATLFTYVHARVTGRARFAVLPLLFLLWANAHGGVLIGYLLMGALLVGETTARWIGTGLDTGSYRRLVIFGVTALLVTMVNPEGPAMVADWIGALTSADRGVETARIDTLGTTWAQLFPDSAFGAAKAMSAWLIVAGFACAAWCLIRRHRRGEPIDPTLILGTLGFFVVSMQIARGVLYLPLFVMMTSVLWFTRDEERPQFVPGGAVAVLTLASVLITMTTWTPGTWFGTGHDRVHPVEASRFVRENDLPGPLFNDYLSGGYLVWDLAPATKVSFDPRFRVYEDEVRREYLALSGDATPARIEHYTRRHDVKTALVDHRVALPLARAFLASEEWTLVFVGPVASVFVRHDVVPVDVARRIPQNTDPRRWSSLHDSVVLGGAMSLLFERDPGMTVDFLAELDAWDPSIHVHRGILRTGLEQALARIAWTASDGRRHTKDAMNARFAALYQQGNFEAARIVAAGYLIEHPDDATMRFNHACVESRRHNVLVAAAALERALDDGYAKPEAVTRDPDLEALRASPAFAPIADRHGLESGGTR